MNDRDDRDDPQRENGTRVGGTDPSIARLLVRVEHGLYDLLELDDVYHLDADGGDTVVRTRSARPRRSSEPLSELLERLPQPPFFRIHRSHAVNLARVRRLRRRESGDWEVQLDPPVNAVLPVSRGREDELFRLLGRRQGA